MASFPSFSTCSLVVMLIMFLLGLVSANSYYPGKLQQCDDPYYKYSCPSALSTIRDIVELAIAKESRMGASLLRLHFHDCFVNGCDASVLLDNTTATNGEKFAAPNLNSLRGFEVIDAIKLKLELECPRTVSCADILAVVARDSVDILRGNSEMYRTWNVKLGRKDSKTASMDAANRNLPPPFLNLKPLLSFFQSKNFTTQETVVLSGGHTIGKARCTTFRDRIYNESNIQTSFADGLKKICPRSGGDDNLAYLDSSTGTFDNTYYTDLVQERGLLHSDQQLYSGGETNRLVESYSKNPVLFFSDFGNAMVKMGDLSPPAGSEPGEVRINCRRRN